MELLTANRGLLQLPYIMHSGESLVLNQKGIENHVKTGKSHRESQFGHKNNQGGANTMAFAESSCRGSHCYVSGEEIASNFPSQFFIESVTHGHSRHREMRANASLGL